VRDSDQELISMLSWILYALRVERKPFQGLSWKGFQYSALDS
jgi:hypothetical protein